MLKLFGHPTTACDGVTRREVLRAGALSLFSGMTLPRLLRARERSGSVGDSRVKSVIVLNLFGGPSHVDSFDMKPETPPEVRGEFKPINTSLDGLQICEHLPKIAQIMHRVTLIRSVTHGYNSHNPYALLTGFTGGSDAENYFTKSTDHPGIGAVCDYLGMGPSDMPCHVFMPSHPGYSQAIRRAGPYGGYLGSQYDPMFTTCEPTFEQEPDPDSASYNPVTPFGEPRLPSLDVLPAVSADRLDRRMSLLGQLDSGLDRVGTPDAIERMDRYQRTAFSMLTSSKAREAFDTSKEPERVRERYGRSLYGSCMLTARRLVEAGVPFVGVTTESKGGGHWDSHQKNFTMLKDFLLPLIDTLVPALLLDLEEHGLLDSTLVVVMGEMGRTPHVNKNAGRDHWPQCGFSLLAGGAVKSGFVYGASDKQARYPTDDPVTPGDIVATIYDLLGVDYRMTVDDLAGQPINIAHGGKPIRGLLA